MRITARLSVLLVAWCLNGCSAVSKPDWNGTWVLDRSRPEPDGAAPEYRLSISGHDAIIWEIPPIGERNVGTIGGQPMSIVRHGVSRGTTLQVWREGTRSLRYRVSENGRAQGEGRMTLAADNRSWTDVPLDQGQPVARLTMVYTRQ